MQGLELGQGTMGDWEERAGRGVELLLYLSPVDPEEIQRVSADHWGGRRALQPLWPDGEAPHRWGELVRQGGEAAAGRAEVRGLLDTASVQRQ